jgi:hypothetical protein
MTKRPAGSGRSQVPAMAMEPNRFTDPNLIEIVQRLSEVVQPLANGRAK